MSFSRTSWLGSGSEPMPVVILGREGEIGVEKAEVIPERAILLFLLFHRSSAVQSLEAAAAAASGAQ